MALTKISSPLVRLRYPISVNSFPPFIRHGASSTHSTPPPASNKKVSKDESADRVAPDATKRKKNKTMAELDEELRLKLEGMDKEGGEAGLELEDGKPAAMKRGVRENMFRVI